MASTYLTRTSTAGNRQKFTTSFWFKLAKADSTRMSFFSATETTDGNELSYMRVDDKIWIREAHSNSSDIHVETNRFFRDTNAWYHVVFTVDTTQATSSDRVKIYVNGVQETSLANATYPSQNYNTRWNESGQVMQIGRNVSAYPYYFDGSISHFHHCDGYAYDASAFGSTDSTTGEWKINTSPSVSYGNNGFFILKDGNSVTDSSPNTNNFTVAGGTLTKTEDCPSNVFATWNPLDNYYAASTFSDGNTSLTSGGSGIETYNTSTLGMSSGKYYMELKHNGGSASPFRQLVGITQNPTDAAGQYLGGDNNDSWGYYDYNGGVAHNASTVVTYSTWTQNDIIGVAVDLDNSKLFFAKNGTWQNSSDPANGTNGISIDSGVTYYFAWGDLTTHSNYCQANFGNGYFGTTAVSSAGTNASNNGIFEYDVPTGYTALSTKGLNL